MNKLELEMTKNNLCYRKELCETLIKADKNSLLLSRVAITFNVLAAMYVSNMSIACIKDERYGVAILEAVLAAINVTLCVVNAKGVKETKWNLGQRKMSLEHICAEIKALEEMVV